MHAAIKLGLGMGAAGLVGAGVLLAVRAGRPDATTPEELAGWYLRTYDRDDDATLELDWLRHRRGQPVTEHTRYAGGWDGHRNIRALLVAADANHTRKVGFDELVTLLEGYAHDGVLGVEELRRMSNRFGLDARNLRETRGQAGYQHGR